MTIYIYIWSDFQACQEIWSFLFMSKSELVRDMHYTKVGGWGSGGVTTVIPPARTDAESLSNRNEY